MKKLLLYALLFTSALAGCKKNSDEALTPPPTPTPPPTTNATTGTITGRISSAFPTVYLGIRVTGPGTSSYINPDFNTGVFTLQDIVPGTYAIKFMTTPPYYFRPDTTLQLVAGQTINLGTLVPLGGGTFKGTISPAGAISYVDAHNTQAAATDPDAYMPLNASADAFTTHQLQPGTYRISFRAASGYKLPSSPVTVTVGAGEVLDLGTVTARPNMLSGLPFNGGATQSYASPMLNIASQGSNQNSGIPSPATNFFTLTMDNITGVGTYPCNRTATSAMTYKVTGFGTRTWSTNYPGGSGTVVITSIDTVKKEIKGTFMATLVSNTAGVADVVINNGSFYFAY